MHAHGLCLPKSVASSCPIYLSLHVMSRSLYQVVVMQLHPSCPYGSSAKNPLRLAHCQEQSMQTTDFRQALQVTTAVSCWGSDLRQLAMRHVLVQRCDLGSVL